MTATQFDAQFYLAQRPDVEAAIATGSFGGTAEDHYNQSGWREGANPNAEFDTFYYLAANPDVLAHGVNPFQHFVNNGISEGRSGSSQAPASGGVGQFDPVFYLSQRPDVLLAIVNGNYVGTAEDHYNQSGWREGSNPNAEFDTFNYLAANPDVLAHGVNPFQHFVNNGISEGRSGSGQAPAPSGEGQFDSYFYFNQRPDVLLAIVNGSFVGTAEDHYNHFGWREGSDPNAEFDTSYYLAANPDVAEAGVNPFQHFVNNGISEGRSGTSDVGPQNQAPTVALANQVATLAENADTTTSIKVADIVVTDADGGNNQLSLAGANAAEFEIVDGVSGKELHLKAGTVLDYETLTNLTVSVAVDDPSVGASPDDTAPFTLAITDVQEIITLDGSLADWLSASAPALVALGAPTPAGHAVYGSYQDSSFIIALQAPEGVTIGENTTLWFNTDLNNTTGQDIFAGVPPEGGAEYNINFGPGGVPALYTGEAGQTPVAGAPPLEYAIGTGGTVLEIALPSALVGGATSAELFVDINDTAPFLPEFFSAGGYMLDDVSIFV